MPLKKFTKIQNHMCDIYRKQLKLGTRNYVYLFPPILMIIVLMNQISNADNKNLL